MLKDKALVRSAVIRAVTAAAARAILLNGLSVYSDGTVGVGSVNANNPPTEEAKAITIIRAARFYKTLSAEPKKKTYITIDKLLPAKIAIEVMTTIENRKASIVIRPEDLMGTLVPTVGPVRPEDYLPNIDPNHVCTDECYDVVKLDPKDKTFAEALADTGFKPVGQPLELTEAPPTPSPYRFPNQPAAPVKDAVFDGPCDRGNATNAPVSTCTHGEYSPMTPEVRQMLDDIPVRQKSVVFVPCRWHGDEYIDPSDGRCGCDGLPESRILRNIPRSHFCGGSLAVNDPPIVPVYTALDPGSKYLQNLGLPERYHTDETEAPALGEVSKFDLDAAAPVIDEHEAERRFAEQEPITPVEVSDPAPDFRSVSSKCPDCGSPYWDKRWTVPALAASFVSYADSRCKNVFHSTPVEVWEPSVHIPSMDEMRQAMLEGQTGTPRVQMLDAVLLEPTKAYVAPTLRPRVEDEGQSSRPRVGTLYSKVRLVAILFVVASLVAAYFKWFAK